MSAPGSYLAKLKANRNAQVPPAAPAAAAVAPGASSVAPTIPPAGAPPSLFSVQADGSRTCVERVQEALDAIAARNGEINACVEVLGEAALKQAAEGDARLAGGAERRPLEGVPFLVKVNIDVAGSLSTASMPGLADHRPESTAGSVQRVIEAGGIVIAKTNMPEAAVGAWGFSPVHGMTTNPVNPKHTTAGSSSGTAAGIKAHMAVIGLGSDTGGSLRMPAECCGVVGMRPSRGRYPSDGVVPCDVMWDTVGPMARTVADLAILDAVMAGESVADSKQPASLNEIGVCFASDLYDSAAPGACAARDLVLAAFAAGGADCKKEGVAFKAAASAIKHETHLHWREKGFDDYIASHPNLTKTTEEIAVKSYYAPVLKTWFTVVNGQVNVKSLPAEEVDAAIAKFEGEREAMTAAYAQMFEDNDVEIIVTPVIDGVPRKAFTKEEHENLENMGNVFGTMSMLLGSSASCHLYNNISVPSLALPTKALHVLVEEGEAAGPAAESGSAGQMTASVCLWGKPGCDKKLIQVAMALELAMQK